MIHVSLTCTNSSGFSSDGCPQIYDTIEPAEAAAWYARTIRENAWTEEDGKPYCPRHNPGENGAILQVDYGEDYSPIGDSGWEMRLPRDGSSLMYARVEVRQTPKRADA